MTRPPDRSTKLLIVIHHRFDLWNVPAWFVEKLKGEFPQLEIVQSNNYDEAAPHVHDSEIVFTLSLRPEQLAKAQRLRWVHVPAAAVHEFLLPELVNSNVVLTNSSEVHGPVVAEHAMALIFALAKKIPQAARLQAKHVWGQDAIWDVPPRTKELAGATLGLIGVGSIGAEVARMASALGMRVIAVRENSNKPKPESVSAVYPVSAINEMLGQADYVVMAAPVTPATRGLMNAERLAAMKPDAFLINVGRGPQVDETALADALRNRRIGGAALDVFLQEPLPSDSPLWDLDSLLITPHTGSLTEKLWPRHYQRFSENLGRYFAGQPLLYTVDKQKGY